MRLPCRAWLRTCPASACLLTTGEGGCDGEAWFSVVFPCGHFHELLCRSCTDLYLEGIEAGCEDCGGPLTCRECGAAIYRLVVRPV